MDVAIGQHPWDLMDRLAPRGLRRWAWFLLPIACAGLIGVALTRPPNGSEERFLMAQLTGLSEVARDRGKNSESWCLTGRGDSKAFALKVERALAGRPGWQKLKGESYWIYTPYERLPWWPATMGYRSPTDARRHLSFMVMPGKATMNPSEKPPKEAWSYVFLTASHPVFFSKGGSVTMPWHILRTP